jgi:integrase
MKAKINKSFVDSVLPPPAGAVYIYDTDLAGFGLRVTPRYKTYFAEARVGGSTVRTTIGRHGPTTPSQARDRARIELGKMADGLNPNLERKRIRKAVLAFCERDPAVLNVLEITLSKALKDYLEMRGGVQGRVLKQTTVDNYKQAVFTYLKEWDGTPLVTINRQMVAEKHAAISLKSRAKADNAMRVLRALFNFAAEHYTDANDEPMIRQNPVQVLSKKRLWNNVRPRNDYLTTTQIRTWWEAVTTMPKERFGDRAEIIGDYYVLLLLTGLRELEGGALKVGDINIGEGTLFCGDTKNREDHLLPVGPYLKSILKRRIEYAREIGSQYIFPAGGKRGHVFEPRTQAAYVSDKVGTRVTEHTLRRTFSTITNSLTPAPSVYTLKRLLNHKRKTTNDITENYVQHEIESLREAMCRIEARFLSLAGQT